MVGIPIGVSTFPSLAPNCCVSGIFVCLVYATVCVHCVCVLCVTVCVCIVCFVYVCVCVLSGV